MRSKLLPAIVRLFFLVSFWPNWLIFADIYGYAAGCTNNKSPYPRRAETFHGVFDATSKPSELPSNITGVTELLEKKNFCN